MAVKSNTAEGGTNGTTITSGNSGGGSGDAFNAVAINSGPTLVYANDQSMHGTLAFKMGTTSAVTTFWDWNGYTASTMAVRMYFRLSALPAEAATTRMIDVRDSANSGVGRLVINSTSKLAFSTIGSTLKTFTNALSINTWYRVELVCSINTGQFRCDYYLGDSSTPVETGYANASVVSGTANNITTVRLGNSGSNTFVGTIWFDDQAASDGVTTYIGPAVTGATVTGVAATATAAFQIPVISGESVVTGGGPATATAAAVAPVVTGGAKVIAVAATASAAAIAPTVSAVRSPTVTGVAATATAAAVAPVVSGVISPTVTAVAATATAQAVAPVVTTVRSPTTTAVAATASAALLAPAVSASGSVIVGAVAATASALAPAPVVTGQRHASVTAVLATASMFAPAPAVGVAVTVIAVRGIATAAAIPPSKVGQFTDVTVLATLMSATAVFRTPGVVAYVPRDVSFNVVNDDVRGHPFAAELSR